MTDAPGDEPGRHYLPLWYNEPMSDESAVKLYAAAFLAYRDVNGQLTLRVKAGLVIAHTDEDAYRDGMEGARKTFPESEDWKDHEVILTEIPRSLELGHYLVKWDAERVHP